MILENEINISLSRLGTYNATPIFTEGSEIVLCIFNMYLYEICFILTMDDREPVDT